MRKLGLESYYKKAGIRKFGLGSYWLSMLGLGPLSTSDPNDINIINLSSLIKIVTRFLNKIGK